MTYKILVVAPSWVGDSVMAQPMYHRLHEKHPDLELHVFAQKWMFPLLERMQEVAQTHANPFEHGQLQLMARCKVARILRAERFDQVIVLPNSLKSALVPFFARIPLRTGYLGEARRGILNDVRILEETVLPKMVDRFYALAEPAQTHEAIAPPHPVLYINQQTQQEAIDLFGLERHPPIVAFCPGAEYGPAKQWPSQHFAALAKKFHNEGYQICLFGAINDVPIAEQINELAGDICTNLCGKTTLAQAIDLLALAKLVVCNDSGLMHISAALKRPLVALYGSSSPDFTPPLSDEAQIMSLNLECSPCFERICPLGHTHCLNQLMPEMVWEAAHLLLDTQLSD